MRGLQETEEHLTDSQIITVGAKEHHWNPEALEDPQGRL